LLEREAKVRYFACEERSKAVGESDIPGVEEGKSEEDLWCKSLYRASIAREVKILAMAVVREIHCDA